MLSLQVLLVGLLFIAPGSADAAIGMDRLRDNQHNAYEAHLPVDDDYYSRSEFSGRDKARLTWRNRQAHVLNRSHAPNANGILILEYFHERNSREGPYIDTGQLFGGLPPYDPILSRKDPFQNAPLWRLDDPGGGKRVAPVPLPPTLPMLAISVAGLAALRRRRIRSLARPRAS